MPGQLLVAGVREAHAVPAAHPEHRGRHAVGAQDAVVRRGFVEREQRVDRSLLEQRRRGDLVDEVARAAIEEPLPVLLADHAGRVAGLVRARDVRVELVRRGPGVEQVAPTALRRVALVEAGAERVPRDLRDDRVDAAVDRGGDELDAAAVRRADHAHARVAGAVELHAGLRGDPVDEALRVAPLELRAVGLDRPARLRRSRADPR